MEFSSPSPMLLYLPSVRCFLSCLRWQESPPIKFENWTEFTARSWTHGAPSLILLSLSHPTSLQISRLLDMAISYRLWREITLFSTHGVVYFVNICIQDHWDMLARALFIANWIKVVKADKSVNCSWNYNKVVQYIFYLEFISYQTNYNYS